MSTKLTRFSMFGLTGGHLPNRQSIGQSWRGRWSPLAGAELSQSSYKAKGSVFPCFSLVFQVVWPKKITAPAASDGADGFVSLLGPVCFPCFVFASLPNRGRPRLEDSSRVGTGVYAPRQRGLEKFGLKNLPIRWNQISSLTAASGIYRFDQLRGAFGLCLEIYQKLSCSRTLLPSLALNQAIRGITVANGVPQQMTDAIRYAMYPWFVELWFRLCGACPGRYFCGPVLLKTEPRWYNSVSVCQLHHFPNGDGL